MKYLLQKHKGNIYPLTKEEWESDNNWDHTETREYHSEEEAIHRLKQDSGLSRMIWPVRIITDDGKVLIVYDPELDTRLPGCRWRIIQRNAYSLWEAAGRPYGNDQRFWYQAEKDLKEYDGIFMP